MKDNLEHAIELLSRTPDALRSLLQGLSGEWIDSNHPSDPWSPRDVVGHLVYGEEANWIPRARLILEFGATRPFEPLDRQAQFERFAGQSLEQLLETFTRLRRQNLDTLRAMDLSPERLERQGTHPEFGRVTLRQLLATWVVHDLNHLGQIVGVMSKQYIGAVGPWKAYLPILGES
jgi:uncharacterized damage-inducible protein DinB